MQSPRVHVIGAGLAGSEAAYYLAQNGFQVTLHEMRPKTLTPAHKTGQCAELVCSNSFKSKSSTSAPGMLKAEMMELGSLILNTATQATVPGGEALAVNRDIFSELITQAIRSHSNIQFSEDEATGPFPDGITLIATGPLTSDGLTSWLEKATGTRDLYFYDAIAPIVDASTIDRDHCFLANRYDKGEEVAYLNCPLTEDEYRNFIQALLVAEKVPPKDFEKEILFQGCQPIESIAATGVDSLRFGPMKPVGLEDPKTGKRPYAVLQLRPENRACTSYNLVGFQTKLKYGEQGRIFRMIPALKNVEFLRLGSIHRNTYVCGPRVLRPDLSLKGNPNVYLAGQITGVEGYLESSAIGLLAALFIQQRIKGLRFQAPPANTALGALLRHVIGSNPDHYGPSNIHFGLFDPAHFESVTGLKRDESRLKMANQALTNFKNWNAGTVRA
jgi:methylenetetrahydrofolate--tRNA-(uracil-5-)-methyltransferase